MLVRTWNVFHGNTSPPGRRAFLREMVELVTADRPAVVCLQEVPLWALALLEQWSGMAASGAVAARPRLRSAVLGRRLTDVNHGLLRSAFTGQANAILVDRALAPGDERSIVLSTKGERRVCQTLRADGIVIANFHVTGGAPADAQFARAAEFAAAQGERVILAGDVNLRPGNGETYSWLHDEGFTEPHAGGIDQILVRGLAASAPAAWPEERRRVDGRLLSDHAPVELTVE